MDRAVAQQKLLSHNKISSHSIHINQMHTNKNKHIPVPSDKYIIHAQK